LVSTVLIFSSSIDFAFANKKEDKFVKFLDAQISKEKNNFITRNSKNADSSIINNNNKKTVFMVGRMILRTITLSTMIIITTIMTMINQTTLLLIQKST